MAPQVTSSPAHTKNQHPLCSSCRDAFSPDRYSLQRRSLDVQFSHRSDAGLNEHGQSGRQSLHSDGQLARRILPQSKASSEGTGQSGRHPV